MQFTDGSWWSYEWCSKLHVRQYHKEGAGAGKLATSSSLRSALGNGTGSVLLGVFDAAAAGTGTGAGTGGDGAAQSFVDGDPCQSEAPAANPLPRQARVQLKCCSRHALRNHIESVVEASRCNYTVTLCHAAACKRPSSRPLFGGDSGPMSEKERLRNREEVREMFYHAYNGYMTHAFPMDNLRPVSCTGAPFSGFSATGEAVKMLSRVTDPVGATSTGVPCISFQTLSGLMLAVPLLPRSPTPNRSPSPR